MSNPVTNNTTATTATENVEATKTSAKGPMYSPEEDEDDMSWEEMQELMRKTGEEMARDAALKPPPKPRIPVIPRLDPGPMPELDWEKKFRKEISKEADAYLDELFPVQWDYSTKPPTRIESKSSGGAVTSRPSISSAKWGTNSSAADKGKTAGPQWFNMPRTVLTPEVKRDLQLLKNRDVLDPKRHYKQDVVKGFPKYSQMGTVIEGSTEYFSARLTKKERKQTILEEVLASEETTTRFKRKAAELDTASRAGKKEHYKKVKDKRRKR